MVAHGEDIRGAATTLCSAVHPKAQEVVIVERVSTKKRLQDWRPLLKEYERRTEQMNVIKLVENLRVDPRAVSGIGLRIISKSE